MRRPGRHAQVREVSAWPRGALAVSGTSAWLTPGLSRRETAVRTVCDTISRGLTLLGHPAGPLRSQLEGWGDGFASAFTPLR